MLNGNKVQSIQILEILFEKVYWRAKFQLFADGHGKNHATHALWAVGYYEIMKFSNVVRHKRVAPHVFGYLTQRHSFNVGVPTTGKHPFLQPPT